MARGAFARSLASSFEELSGLHLKVAYDPVEGKVHPGQAQLVELEPQHPLPPFNADHVDKVSASMIEAKQQATTIQHELEKLSALVRNRNKDLPEDIFALHERSMPPGLEVVSALCCSRASTAFAASVRLKRLPAKNVPAGAGQRRQPRRSYSASEGYLFM
eukprot:TRINITY_DN104004_c0_g1_i1.p1 TRINITY_DN104004_c0_g1~~TRINITY_DN104004_c0_g1_i1.p1  ORF type:complete len:161 (+),score=23.75 TRINITY_DN104004_c0_g1_i1:175-657(+)